jgi:hypothetical protein
MTSIQIKRKSLRARLNARGVENRLPRIGRALVVCPPGQVAMWIENIGNDQFQVTATGDFAI